MVVPQVIVIVKVCAYSVHDTATEQIHHGVERQHSVDLRRSH